MILHSRRPHRGCRSDSGSASVELAVLVPAALVLLLVVLQAGLWWHTRNLALHAAEHGAHAARTTTGSSAAARAATSGFLARGPSTAGAPAIRAHRGADAVTVQVSLSPPRLLPVPGLDPRITQHARAPVERVTTPGE